MLGSMWGRNTKSIARWWRKLLKASQVTPRSGATAEEGIVARVDMVRLEALAEAAYAAMQEARLRGAKERFEDARYYFERAIEAAKRAGLLEEAARLQMRRDYVVRVYRDQFRYSSGG